MCVVCVRRGTSSKKLSECCFCFTDIYTGAEADNMDKMGCLLMIVIIIIHHGHVLGTDSSGPLCCIGSSRAVVVVIKALPITLSEAVVVVVVGAAVSTLFITIIRCSFSFSWRCI